ncbi:MAG: hypothetical protein PHE55_13585, partial [Methylococcaceae bacterium]|nr:hypothetical protein [Methylococcaceae bacterium]
MLENIRIAAAEYGHVVEITRRLDSPEEKPTFDIVLREDDTVRPDPLFPHIPLRSTQRRSLSPRPLSGLEKQRLEMAVAPNYQLVWLEGWANKRRAAKLMFNNAKLRLTMPEAYEVHKSVIEGNAAFIT